MPDVTIGGSCHECRWWDETAKTTDSAVCQKLSNDDDAMLTVDALLPGIDDLDESPVVLSVATRFDFGCVQFAPRVVD
jgi:hypothetical protein